ncbi:hypothetical protein ALQ85_102438 [Pseudomonas syringae]|nr:hypothetical protein ALQ85_102438 [Pseudomonas syringae]
MGTLSMNEVTRPFGMTQCEYVWKGCSGGLPSTRPEAFIGRYGPNKCSPTKPYTPSGPVTPSAYVNL